MSLVHHHKSIRQRLAKKYAPFPHPIRWKRQLDRSVTFLGLGNIIATSHQAYQIWSTQDASGVSVVSWAYFSLFAAVFAFYGFVHSEKPIIITYTGLFMIHSVITAGIIMYS